MKINKALLAISVFWAMITPLLAVPQFKSDYLYFDNDKKLFCGESVFFEDAQVAESRQLPTRQTHSFQVIRATDRVVYVTLSHYQNKIHKYLDVYDFDAKKVMPGLQFWGGYTLFDEKNGLVVYPDVLDQSSNKRSQFYVLNLKDLTWKTIKTKYPVYEIESSKDQNVMAVKCLRLKGKRDWEWIVDFYTLVPFEKFQTKKESDAGTVRVYRYGYEHEFELKDPSQLDRYPH